jgi:hypothetical protein
LKAAATIAISDMRTKGNAAGEDWRRRGLADMCWHVQATRALLRQLPAGMQVTTNFAYLPFGGGKRKCIGDQFALFEAIVALAMLSRRFTFEADSNRPEAGMTTGMHCSLTCVLAHASASAC